MQKIFIQNRNGKNISVIVENPPEQKGLAFVMHGLGGWKEERHIEVFAQAFKENNYTVVRFDARNTFGESEGEYTDATTTGYYEDLEDVIEWAKSQEFYKEPFVLAGHSLGAFCVALYAENNPEKVKALAPISTVVSGKLSAVRYSQQELDDWKKIGWVIKGENSRTGALKKIKWAEMEDRLRYDLLLHADRLTMPVLLSVGTEDFRTPLAHQNLLYEALPGKKELHVIEGAPHTFREPQHLEEIKQIFNNWIQNNL